MEFGVVEMIPDKMMAVVTYGPHDSRYEEVPVPSVGPGEILIRMEGCGICAGDVKAWKGASAFWGYEGQKPYLEPPAIGGHEFVGRIVAMGADIDKKETYGVGETDFKIGDRVAVEQLAPCGTCRYCREGKYSLCLAHNVFGFKNYLNGGFAEYVLLPKESLIYKIPEDMPLEAALLIEPFSCSMHAVKRAKITSADVVVISGAGCLGLGMVTAAKTLDPKLLISLDLSDDRLAQAIAFGADMGLNPRNEDVVSHILELTDGYGCDVYIEATGYPASVIQGVNCIKKGGHFVEFSVFMDETTLNWSILGDHKELDLYGVSLSPGCFPEVIEGLYSGKLKSKGVVTHTFALSDYQEALKTSANGKDAAGAASNKVVFVNP